MSTNLPCPLLLTDESLSLKIIAIKNKSLRYCFKKSNKKKEENCEGHYNICKEHSHMEKK